MVCVLQLSATIGCELLVPAMVVEVCLLLAKVDD